MSGFFAAFGVESRGVQLESIDHIVGLGAEDWAMHGEEIILAEIDGFENVRIPLDSTVFIGEIITDQPIVIDFSVAEPRVIALLGPPPYSWTVLSGSVDEFLDKLGL